MDVNGGCVVGGNELVYFEFNKRLTCFFCGNEFLANVSCTDGHYVCDNCHQDSGMDLIESFCKITSLTDPLEMAIKMMEHPGIHLHGPEHHFLPAAVLITAYYKARGETDLPARFASGGSADKAGKIEKALQIAKQRCEIIPGGMCGTHGSCGAALSAGVFISIITGATPLAKKEWGLTNKMTSLALSRIAESGGPRCCKRVTYQSILEAIKFIKENFYVDIICSNISGCRFYKFNKECLFKNCEFYNPKVQITTMQSEINAATCCSGETNEFKNFFGFIEKKISN